MLSFFRTKDSEAAGSVEPWGGTGSLNRSRGQEGRGQLLNISGGFCSNLQVTEKAFAHFVQATVFNGNAACLDVFHVLIRNHGVRESNRPPDCRSVACGPVERERPATDWVLLPPFTTWSWPGRRRYRKIEGLT